MRNKFSVIISALRDILPVFNLSKSYRSASSEGIQLNFLYLESLVAVRFGARALESEIDARGSEY